MCSAEARSRMLAAGVRWTVLLLTIASFAAAAATADVHLALPARALHGLHGARTSPNVARGDLAAGLPRALAGVIDRAELDTAAAAGKGQQVRSDAFVFASARTAAKGPGRLEAHAQSGRRARRRRRLHRRPRPPRGRRVAARASACSS